MAEHDLCVSRVPIFQGLTREQQLDVVSRTFHGTL